MKIIYTCPQCGGDLQEQLLASDPPINKKVCSNCGWSHEEREQTIRIPFYQTDNNQPNFFDTIPSPCKACNNHPSNGGSGIVCMLGTIVTY